MLAIEAGRGGQLVFFAEPDHGGGEFAGVEFVTGDDRETGAKDVAAWPVVVVHQSNAQGLTNVIRDWPHVLARTALERGKQTLGRLPVAVPAHHLRHYLPAGGEQHHVEPASVFAIRA